MTIYDNFLVVGDFNSEMTESATGNDCGTHHLHNLIKFLISYCVLTYFQQTFAIHF